MDIPKNKKTKVDEKRRECIRLAVKRCKEKKEKQFLEMKNRIQILERNYEKLEQENLILKNQIVLLKLEITAPTKEFDVWISSLSSNESLP
jgi:hypothetical protein